MAQSIKKLRLALEELEKCDCTPFDLEQSICIDPSPDALNNYPTIEKAFTKIADQVQLQIVEANASKKESVRIIKRLLTACFGETKVAQMTQDEMNEKFEWLFWKDAPKKSIMPAMAHADAWAERIEQRRLMDCSSSQISDMFVKFMPDKLMFSTISPQHRMLELARTEPWVTYPNLFREFLDLEDMKETTPNAFYATAKVDCL
jgi:hypothetical protein